MRFEPKALTSFLPAAVLVAVVTLAVFWPVLGNEFTNYDDRTYVTANRHVRTGLTLESAAWALTATAASNWHPLTWLSHMLDWSLYGEWAGGHHLTSLLLHLANALLLLWVLQRMTGAPWRSAFVALLFAVHPLHVESVAWVAERKDVLSTLFWMLGLGAWAGYARRPHAGRYAVVAVVLGLGLTAKPMLVTLPFVLLLLDWWPLGRWTDRGAAWRLAREKLLLMPLVAASCIVTFVVQSRGGSVGPLDRYPLGQRVANAVVAYAEYLRKAVWPRDLAVYYPHPGADLPAWKVLASGLVLVLVSVAVVRARRRAPYLLFGWLWFLGTLVPVIGIVQVGTQAMADRYTYVPLIGIFIMVAWGVPDALGRTLPKPRVAGGALAVAAIAALAFAARIQVGYWHDSVTLFEHALHVTRENPVAHNNLGIALFETNRVDDAIAHYREAVRIDPNQASALSNLGFALVHRGRSREAVPLCERALKLRPDSAPIHNNLGLALAAEKRFDEAERQYREALRIDPDYAIAHGNLGLAFALQGRREEARREYELAVRLAPKFAEAHNNLGLVLAKEGRVEEALGHFEAAVRAKPDYAKAHFNRAGALFLLGRYAESWQAIRLARRYGFDPPPSFLERLRAKMPEPAG